MLCENLAWQLEQIRKAHGLNVAEFSEKIGIARSSLQAILHGNANPRADTVEHIAEALHVDPVSLLLPSPDSSQTVSGPDLTRSQLLESIREMLREDDHADDP